MNGNTPSEHRGGTGPAVDPQLIRLRILFFLAWPSRSRDFVGCVAAASYGRNGWFPYGHFFMANLLGLAGSDQANSKAVQRALNNYEFDSITIGRHLFEFKRGGGKSKVITSYGANFLNQAALWIVRELSHSPSSEPRFGSLLDKQETTPPGTD
jgi:hypothetical protein